MNYPFWIACFFLPAGLIGVLLYLHKDKDWNTHKIARLGLMLAMAIALGMLESMLPDFFLPGFKLGLANAIILFILFSFSWSEALIVDALRVFIVCLLRGTLFQMGGWMSMMGALLSFVCMLIIRYAVPKKSEVLASVIGAIAHNLGQILVAYWVLGSVNVFYYFPLMCLLGVGFGIITGLLSYVLRKRGFLKRISYSE